MNLTTDLSQKRWQVVLRWTCLILLSCLVLGWLYSIRPLLVIPYPVMFCPYPWLIAGAKTINEGIEEFVGNVAVGNDPTAMLKDSALAFRGLLFGFIIAPTLFFFGLRGLYLPKPSRVIANLFFILGGALTLVALAPAIPFAISQHISGMHLRNDAGYKDTRDSLEDQLQRVTDQAFIYWLLPREKGGGQRSFVGYQIPQSMDSTRSRAVISSCDVNRIVFTASSSKYPGSSIRVELDSAGTSSLEYDKGVFKELDQLE